jgi:membrane fusion protein, multidrug efflux system
MKRKIIIIAVIIVVAILVSLKLFMNKKQIDADAKPRDLNVNVPVIVEPVREANVDNSFSVNGVFSPAHELTIISQTQGQLVSVEFSNGDYVREGQVLASCDLEMLNAQKALADANLAKARSDQKKFEEMLKNKAVSQQEVEQMQLAFIKAQTDAVTVNKQIEYSIIKAPFSGYITKKYVEKGGMLMPGSMIAEMIDINTLKFTANVAETDVINIKKEQPVKLAADIYNGYSYKGTIKYIGMKADDARRFPVEVEVRNNLQKPVKAGMFGIAYFDCEGTHNALIIPRTALVGSIRDAKVFTVENNKAVRTSVKVGTATETTIEILEGLKAGDKVVVSGQINLDDNTSVKITNAK